MHLVPLDVELTMHISSCDTKHCYRPDEVIDYIIVLLCYLKQYASMAWTIDEEVITFLSNYQVQSCGFCRHRCNQPVGYSAETANLPTCIH